MYQSTTKIYILNKQNSSSVITYTDLQTGSQLTNDYMTLIKSRPVTEKVIQDLNLEIHYSTLANLITVSNPANTRALYITVEYWDPVMAKDIADSVREAAAVHIQNVMKIDQVNLIEAAYLPDGPSGPSIMRNTMLGGIFGSFLAGFIIILIRMLDDTVKTPDDIEHYLNLSVLGSIPLYTPKKKSKKKYYKPYRRRFQFRKNKIDKNIAKLKIQ